MTAVTLDPLGRWFQARVNNGVDDAMHAALLNRDGTVLRRWKVAHRLHDGRGALSTLLAQSGLEAQAPALNPRMTPVSAQQLLGLRPWRTVPTACAPPWREQDAVGGPPAPVMHRVLPPGSLALLEQQARHQAVSLASLLMWAEHRAVVETLCTHDAGGTWFVPVDMRPAVPGSDGTGNCSAGVYIHLPPACQPADVHQRLRTALKAGQHWWNWYQAVLVSRLGQRALDWLYPRLSSPGRYLGSFSMLGHWAVRTNETFAAGDCLMICGPGSPAYPVSNGVTITNGQLVLALRVDSQFDPHGSGVAATLAAWADQLQRLCNQAPAQEVA